MNRFLKSAAFPILVVILLAYFAQQLILSKGDSTQSVGWSGFVQKLDQKNSGIVKMKVDPTKNSITYQLNDQKGTKYTTGYPGDIQLSEAVNKAQADNVLIEVTTKGGSPWWSLLTYLLPFVLFLGLWVFLMNQMQGGGSKVMSFGKSRAKRMAVDSPKITLPGRRRRRRGRRGAARDQGVPREPQEVPGARRAHPQGRAAVRAPRHRQDAAGARRRRRGRGAVLLDLGLRLRRDVRRRRRLARARPVRAGQAELAVHHLHGRDRRRRPSPRCRPRRRARRARADAEPAPRRDGRVRAQGQHHHDRGHEPARHPRPGPAAARSLRSPDRRRPPGSRGAQEDPRGAHHAASRSARRSSCPRWQARRPASPAPISRTWSTRPRCWPPATAAR